MPICGEKGRIEGVALLPGTKECVPLEQSSHIPYDEPELLTRADQETAVEVAGRSAVLEKLCHVGNGRDISALMDIQRVVHELPRACVEDKVSVILTRGAEQIFSEGLYGGCHDYAIAFASVARAAGFPVIFIDSAATQFLSDHENLGKRGGHVFLKVMVEGEWILVDPTEGSYYDDIDFEGDCLPGHIKKDDEKGAYRSCDRIKMYELVNLWDVGFGGVPLGRCLDMFKDSFVEDPSRDQIKFRPKSLR